MSAVPKTEFVVGELLTFSGVLESAIRIIDNYSRWEILLSLQERIGWLASPAASVVLLIAGLILIHRSMQQRAAEAIKQAGQARLHDADDKPIVQPVKLPSVGVTVLVASCASAVACLYAGTFIMHYSPTPKPLLQVISVPRICKTADCWPPRHVSGTSRPSIVVTASGSIVVGQVGGTGNVVNPTINNFTPPSRILSQDDSRTLLAALSSTRAKAIIMAPIYDKEAFDFAGELYGVFKAAGWNLPDSMVRGILAKLPPGVRVGFHGEAYPDNAHVEITDSSLPGKVILALHNAHVKGLYVNSRPDTEEGTLEIVVSGNPDSSGGIGR